MSLLMSLVKSQLDRSYHFNSKCTGVRVYISDIVEGRSQCV